MSTNEERGLDLDSEPLDLEALDKDLDAIVQRLKAGESSSAIAFSLRPDGERELLRRCAASRVFDRTIVDQVLRPFRYSLVGQGLAGTAAEKGGLSPELAGRSRVGPVDKQQVPWDVLVGNPIVERVRRGKGLYRIRPADRQDLLRTWESSDSGHKAVRSLHKALRKYWESKGNSIEGLYHASVINPANSLGGFERAFDEAEEAFDLTACANLLGAYDRPGLPARSRLSVVKRRARLESRGLWAEEYYRTARFVRRPDLAAALDRVLDLKKSGPWALQLHAKGGMGKTQFLRWALARRCVPSGIPCARLDFDVANARTLADQPAKLALALAEPLDHQLAGSPLAILLDELRRDSAGPDPIGRLAAAMPDALPPDTPALVILDTVEEVLLPRPDALAALLGELVALHERCPSIRLLIAGRYDIRDSARREASCPIPSDESIDLAVPGFSKDESLEFLKLNLPGLSDELRDAVVQLSDGIPLRLALYAEILEEHPEKSVDELRAEGKVDLIYLIRRIILRLKLKDGSRDRVLALVLRYGAVPLMLAKDFLADVIVPNLAEALRLDELEAGLPERLRQARPFDSDTGMVDAESLWQRLSTYAGASSWVQNAVTPDGVPALRLQTEVLNPMRRLLRKNPVVPDLLHDAAHAKYRALASAPSVSAEQRARWICEATYHDFQRRGANAAPRWRAEVDDRTLRDHPQARRALAEEVTGTAYVNDDGDPRDWSDDRPMIAPSDLAEAYDRLASANVDLARGNPPDADRYWREADTALGRRDRLASRFPKVGPRSTRQIPALAAVLAHRGSLGQALAELEPVLASSDRAAGYRTLGDIWMSQPRPNFEAAATAYRTSIHADAGVLDRDRFTAIERCEVRASLARAELAMDRLHEALEACPKPDDINAELEPRAAKVCLLRLEILNRAGLHSEVIETAAPSPSSNQDDPFNLCCAEASLELLEPVATLKWLDLVDAGVEILAHPDPTRLRAMELRGRANAALLQFPTALDQLDQVRKGWADLARPADADRALAHLVEARFFGLGEQDSARAMLRERFLANRGASPIIELEMLRAEILDFADARAIIERSLKASIEIGPPRQIALVAIRGLRFADVPDDHFLAALVSALEQVTPPSARAALLDPLERSPTREATFGKEVTARFLKLFELTQDLKSRDSGLFSLRIAEAFRLVGQPEAAAVRLEDAVVRLMPEQGSRFPLLSLARGFDRIKRPERGLALVQGQLSQFLEEFSTYPLLRMTALLDQASRALGAGNFEVFESAMDAALAIDAESGELKWHRERARINGLQSTRRRLLHGSDDAESIRLLELALDHYRSLRSDDPLALSRDLDRRSGMSFQASAVEILGLSDESDTPTATLEAGEIEPSRPLFPTGPAFPIGLRSEGEGEVVVELAGSSLDGKPAPTPVMRRLGKTPHLVMLMDQLTFVRIGKEHVFKDRWISLRKELTQVLFGVDQPFFASQQPVDLRIDAVDPLAARIPWELMVAGEGGFAEAPGVRFLYRSVSTTIDRQVRRLQLALKERVAPNLTIDGLDGPALREALKTFQRGAELPATGSADAETRAVLWRGSSPSLIGPVRILASSEPGSSILRPMSPKGLEPTSIEYEYLRRGFHFLDSTGSALQVSQPPTARSSISSAVGGSDRILHIAASLQEDISLGVHFRIKTSGGELVLTPTAFSEAVENDVVGIPKTLVVLDPPRPASHSEAIRQLWLRNEFAARLAACVDTPDILATGLGRIEGDQARRMTEALIEDLARCQPLGAIADRLRRLARPGDQTFEDVLGPLSTVLYCRDPEGARPGGEIGRSPIGDLLCCDPNDDLATVRNHSRDFAWTFVSR